MEQTRDLPLLRFGVFEADLRTGELRRSGRKVAIQDQPFHVLAALLARPGQMVSREELRDRLWAADTFVDFETGLNKAVAKIRDVIGDSATSPRFIETLPRRGYRFIAPVEAVRVASEATLPRRDSGSNGTAPPTRSKASPWFAELRHWQFWIAALALVLVGVVMTLPVRLRHDPGAGTPRNLERLTFDSGLQLDPTWSPDRRFIAFSSDHGGNFDIWIQQVGSVTPLRLTTRPGQNWQPDWSPDGSQIVFRSEGEGGGLLIEPALGGPERRISSFGYHPRWSPDGRRILFGNTLVSWLNKLYVVGLDGEPPREILADFLTKERIAARAAEWYPRGNRVSIWGEGAHGSAFWTVSLDGSNAVESGATPAVAELLGQLAGHERARFRWAPSGRAIYFEGEWKGVRNIWKMTVDPSTMQFVALERLTTGPGPDGDLTISGDGKALAYEARSERVRVWSYPFDANAGRVLGEGNAVTPAGLDAWRADVSRDGRKLVYLVNRAGKHELWQATLPDGSATLLLRAPDTPSSPRWSPDSRRIGYRDYGAESAGGPIVLPEGGGSAERVTSAEFEGSLADWSSDGQWIVTAQEIHDQPGRPEYRIVLLPVSAAPRAETRARVVTSSRSQGIYQGIYEIRLSPDGRWIVFEAVTGGLAPGGDTNAMIWVVPVSGGAWIRITDGQFWDDKPNWSPDGKTIFYISSRTGFLNVWGIHFDPQEGRPLGEPFQVTSFDNPKLMVADDLDWQSVSLSHDRLVLSMKETSGSIWALHDVDR